MFTWSESGIRFLDQDGVALPYAAGSWTVPAGAVRVEGVDVSVSWSSAWNLDPAGQRNLSADCDPGEPPTP